MKPSRGNYVPWSLAQIGAGVLCGVLTLAWSTGFLPILLVTLSVLAGYRFMFRWNHPPGEAENRAMLRVFSLSSMATLAVMTLGKKWFDPHWINALWSIALISRGVFGLAVFLAPRDLPADGRVKGK